jgi:hypothetical protein
MGGPVELVEASNGAIAYKRLMDGVEKVTWTKPTIEEPAEGIWVFGGYTLAPISIIETDEGLIAFDTGDTKHDGETLLKAIRTVSDKPRGCKKGEVLLQSRRQIGRPRLGASGWCLLAVEWARSSA